MNENTATGRVTLTRRHLPSPVVETLRSDLEKAGLPLTIADTVIGDAVVFGDLRGCAELLGREIEIGYSNLGEKTRSGRWKSIKVTINDLIVRQLSQHKEGEKGGSCFTQGALLDGQRRANAVPTLDLCVLDLDTGVSISEIRQKLQDLGLFGLLYTSHSNGKPITKIRKDALIKWVGGDVTDPTVEQVSAYLQEVRRYQSSVLEGAELVGTKHEADGVMVMVRHKPLCKLRVVMVLQNQYVVAERGSTQRDALAEWRERYLGVSKLLGAYADRSCTDPSRLFFLPRHPKGAADFRIEIIAGSPLDLDKVDRVTKEELRQEASSRFDEAARALGGGTEYVTTGLKRFFGKYGDRLELDALFLELDPDGDYGPRGSGAGRHHRCPNADAHSDGDSPDDRGHFVVNVSDGDSAVSHCMHASCADMDRIKRVDLLCQRAGITDATELRRFVPDIVEDDDEDQGDDKPNDPDGAEDQGDDKPEKKHLTKFKNPAEAKRAISSLDQDDAEGAPEIAKRIGMSGFGSVDVDILKKLLVKKSGLGAKAIGDEIKASKPADDAETYDDDVRTQLARMNRDYAVVMMGGKFRIMMEPDAPGRAPDMVDRDTFSAWFENKKVPVLDGQGNKKMTSLGKLWREWSERREYRRVVFKPGAETPGEYNIWKGLAVKPRRGNWGLLRAHMFDNICQCNQVNFDWLMTWMAQLLQQPGDKRGSSVVVKGKKGVGKSTLFDWLRKALGEHALKVSRREEIVGGFNMHQQGIILLVCEEAFWAGDKGASGALKDLITSDEMLLTPKGVDSIRFDNFMRLAMVSNETWVVPAGLEDERRFFVVECGDIHRNDVGYFAAIDQQMKAGGLAAMVDELLAWKPSMFPLGWDVLRTPPETPWLAEQGRQDLGAPERFLVHVARSLEQEGGIAAFAEYQVPTSDHAPLTFQMKDSTRLTTGEIMIAFVEWMRWTGETNRSRKVDEMALAKALKDVWRAKPGRTNAQRFYICPPVPEIQTNVSGWLKEPDDAAPDAE